MAAWERLRDEFDSFPGSVKKKDGYDGYDPIVKWGPNAGIYKTSDAGKPGRSSLKDCQLGKYGRVGLNYYRKNPKIVYAIVDTENIGKGTPPPSVYLGVSGTTIKNQVKLTTITPMGQPQKLG